MRKSMLPVQPRQELMTDIFMGYRHWPRIKDGEFYDTLNMSSRYFPMLAPRQRRGKYLRLVNGQGLIEKDSLAYVDNGTLYVNKLATPITGLQPGMKQLVSMGAYICIFPDKVYYNTEDAADYGSMEAKWEYTGTVSYAMCKSDGTLLPPASTSPSPPEAPADKDYWIDRENNTLQQWSAASAMWISIETVYTKVSFTTQGQIPALFKELDGVEVSGLEYKDLNGSKIIYAMGGKAAEGSEEAVNDFIVLVGIPDNAASYENTVKVERLVPAMDYVCEAGNRLWGCFYGNDGEKNLNEIYCCARGDFKNWNQFLGTADDSWTASIGSDGAWTGAVNYLGQPTFFKEHHIHIVSISSIGAHQLTELTARGVEKGSYRSLVVVNEKLFYKSQSDICAYQGGFPESVSEALGEERYTEAAAGAIGEKYYISMKAVSGEWALFCFDINKGVWMKEDKTHAAAFAEVNNELYMLTDKNEIITINGSAGEKEGSIEWSCESGLMYYQLPGKKYLSRYLVRLSMGIEAEARLYIEYDSSGSWEYAGSIKTDRTGTVYLPVRPRRCDHLRMRLEGYGEVKIFSITRTLQKGSDMK